MQAHDRTLPQWFEVISLRQITLPRFQRFTAWDHSSRKCGAASTNTTQWISVGRTLVPPSFIEQEVGVSYIVLGAPYVILPLHIFEVGVKAGGPGRKFSNHQR
jgi:hypothetical protein